MTKNCFCCNFGSLLFWRAEGDEKKTFHSLPISHLQARCWVLSSTGHLIYWPCCPQPPAGLEMLWSLYGNTVEVGLLKNLVLGCSFRAAFQNPIKLFGKTVVTFYCNPDQQVFDGESANFPLQIHRQKCVCKNLKISNMGAKLRSFFRLASLVRGFS